LGNAPDDCGGQQQPGDGDRGAAGRRPGQQDLAAASSRHGHPARSLELPEHASDAEG
jgi:hypothetical protein